MIKAAIEKIEAIVAPKIIEVEGRQYSTKTIKLVEDPKQAALEIHTLTGLRDYILGNPDGIFAGAGILHIVDPNTVNLVSIPNTIDKLRTFYAIASRVQHDFDFGNPNRITPWLDVESFIIALNSYFVPTDNIKLLLEFVSELTQESSESLSDSGITQGVTKKKTITSARLERSAVPNPITLKPYRTFNEVDQPESQFTFRLRVKNGEKPQCALFEADGGAWKLRAIQNIRDWFVEETPDVTILA